MQQLWKHAPDQFIKYWAAAPRRETSSACQVGMGSPDQNLAAKPETPASPVALDYKSRRLEMYSVSGPELDALASGSGSLNSVFFGATFGAAISFLVTVLTAPLSDRLNALFWAFFLATVTLAFYFGIKTWQDRVASQEKIREIKEGPRQL